MTISAACPDCGQMVHLLRLPRTSLPVAMDQATIDIAYWTEGRDGSAQPGGAFVEHACKVDPLRLYQNTWLAPMSRNNVFNDAALALDCPKCGAKAGKPCWNLAARNRGEKEHTKNPHVERYPEEVRREYAS